MERYDVAVIGAGPAGSMAAKKAVEAGAEVVIFEEHPRAGWPVQCAGLLGVRAMEEAELAVGHRAIRPVRGAKVVSPGGVQLTFRAPETKAWVVDRRIFDRALLAAAARSTTSGDEGGRRGRSFDAETTPRGRSPFETS